MAWLGLARLRLAGLGSASFGLGSWLLPLASWSSTSCSTRFGFFLWPTGSSALTVSCYNHQQHEEFVMATNCSSKQLQSTCTWTSTKSTPNSKASLIGEHQENRSARNNKRSREKRGQNSKQTTRRASKRNKPKRRSTTSTARGD